MSILDHLRDRPLGPGEMVYVVSMSEALDITETELRSHLAALGIKVRRGAATVDVPTTAELAKLLRAYGLESAMLEPWKALREGQFHAVKWFENKRLLDDGRFRLADGRYCFDVTWKGKAGGVARSEVCCSDLNASARAHVSSLS